MELKEKPPTWKGSLCSPDPRQQLLTAFLDRDLPTFQKILNQGIRDSYIDPNRWFGDPHHGTLLDLACRKPNNSDYVRTLLQAGADPNRINFVDKKAPLHFTIETEDLPSFQLILEDSRTDPNILDDKGNSPLHYAVLIEETNFQKKLLQHSKIDVNLRNKGGDTALNCATKQSLNRSQYGIDCSKRLEFLLEHVERTKLDMNLGDTNGNAPLHCAARNGHPRVTLLLLRHGAYLGQRNKCGELALANINPKILENYLDQCLFQNNDIFKEDQIIFDYKFLVPPSLPVKSSTSQDKLQTEANLSNKSDDNQLETDLLFHMARSADLRPLLKHPIISSFIHLKWTRVRLFFYINLIFFLIFCTLLTVYILCFYAQQPIENETTGNCSRPTRDEHEKSQNGHSEQLYVAITVFLIILIIREIFQLSHSMFISPFSYIYDLDNVLEIALIAVTILILSGNRSGQQPFSAIALLLSWAELMLLIGRHPSASVNIEMLKVVLKNFVKFFALYSILFLAFAFSFYSLFGISHPNNCTKVEDNIFQKPEMSVFKTIIMFTGELDTDSIPFAAHPGVSHVLFVIFVFLIPLVLLNLLNGLAVSDTQAIRADAELVSYVSKVKLVYYVEIMDQKNLKRLRDFFTRSKRLCCFLPDINFHLIEFSWSRVIFKGTNILSEIAPDYSVYFSRRNTVLIYRRDDLVIREWSSMGTMDPTIIKAAVEIVTRRETDNDRDKHLVERLECYKDQLVAREQSLEQRMLQTQSMVQQVLDTMANKNH